MLVAGWLNPGCLWAAQIKPSRPLMQRIRRIPTIVISPWKLCLLDSESKECRVMVIRSTEGVDSES